MRILPVNTDILLVELDSLAQAVALDRSLMDRPIDGVHEIVPASRTVMVRFHPTSIDGEELSRQLLDRDVDAPLDSGGELVEVPVDYSGEDLPEVAELTGLSVAEVVARHTAATYAVAFTGFTPGFAYLVGGDPALVVPRRRVPRTAIPAGAVGLAGGYSGVYPRTSPGGWQIIGTTGLPMFDLASDPPALLRPGMRVRFVDAARLPDRSPLAPVVCGPCVAQGQFARLADATGARALVVEEPGLGATLQDLGRPGHADLGVSRSGALDHRSLRCADRLVGNPSDAACIETYGGLRLRAVGDRVLALAGARMDARILPDGGGGAPEDRADAGRPRLAPYSRPFALCDGEILEIGFPLRGAVGYVGVRGGFAIGPVLGSLSSDILSGLGPPPLTSGDVLAVGGTVLGAVAQAWPKGEDPASGAGADPLPAKGEVVTLDVVLGPRAQMFTEQAREILLSQEWEITRQSNRVGLRLHGELALERGDDRELESEGTASGALEVPPNGQPVLFMADYPLTGGYPVIASVASHHLDLAGQTPIGARIRLRPSADRGKWPGPQEEDRP